MACVRFACFAPIRPADRDAVSSGRPALGKSKPGFARSPDGGRPGIPAHGEVRLILGPGGRPIHSGFTKYSSIFNKGQLASTVPETLHNSIKEVAPIFFVGCPSLNDREEK